MHLHLIGTLYFNALLCLEFRPNKGTQKSRQKRIYLDHNAAAAHYLAGFALTVNLAQTNPLTKLLVVINLK